MIQWQAGEGLSYPAVLQHPWAYTHLCHTEKETGFQATVLKSLLGFLGSVCPFGISRCYRHLNLCQDQSSLLANTPKIPMHMSSGALFSPMLGDHKGILSCVPEE